MKAAIPVEEMVHPPPEVSDLMRWGIALHEGGGHALVRGWYWQRTSARERELQCDYFADIDPSDEHKAMGIGGYVGSSEKPQPRRKPKGLISRLPAKTANAILNEVGAGYYGGIAAQFPAEPLESLSMDALWYSEADREELVFTSQAIGHPRPYLDHASWLRATRIVDQHWGAAWSIARELYWRGRLYRDDILRIAAKAPGARNVRPANCLGTNHVVPSKRHWPPDTVKTTSHAW